MTVYVETNFVLEIALMQAEQKVCDDILNLATSKKIELVLPAFCVGESYGALVGRIKQRKDAFDRFGREIGELSRSTPYQQQTEELLRVTSPLVKSGDEEKKRLDEALIAISGVTGLIPLDFTVMKNSVQYQKSTGLSPQDSVVYASIISNIKSRRKETNCFITKNSRDFVTPDIKKELKSYNCELLTTFADGIGFIKSKLIRS